MNKRNENSQTGRPVNIELLLDYLDGIVDEDTAKSLSRQISQSDELSSIVEGIKFYYEKKGEDRESLEKYLNSLAGSHPQWLRTESTEPADTNRAVKSTRYIFYRAAAVLAFAILAGIVIIQFINSAPSSDKLAARELSETYDPPVIVRGEESGNEQNWVEATEAYKKGEFEEAALLFQKITENQPDNRYASFYSGLSYLYARQPEDAIPYLDSASASQSRMKEQAMWYLALAHYLNNETEAAREKLRSIVAENEFKKKEAERLVEALND